MGKQTGTLTFAAAAGFVVLRLVSPAAVPSPPAPETMQSEAARTGEQPPPAAAEPEGPCRHVQEYLWSHATGCFPDSVTGYMIATVPDPVETQLALVFDRSIESILSAFGDTGYDFATYWLPWEAPPADGPEQPRKPLEKQERLEKKQRAGEPGVLLFRNRREPASENYFAVLLVGEAPTSGIRRDVFEKAVQYIGGGLRGSPIPLLAPTFSGSVPSLKLAIRNGGPFRIVSGSATGRQAGDTKPDPLFQATVNDDQAGIAFVIKILGEKYEGRDVAIIGEAETSYGSTAPPGTDSPLRTFLRFRFPRGIWRLRNAYQNSEMSKTPAESKSQPVRRNLPIELRDATTGRDSVPVYATAQTPSSQDAVLGAIAVTLQRSHIPLAVIAATDPLDVIFVTSYLRTACPDVRLVVLGSDLLLANAAADLPVQGVLSVTTYPLFPRNQWWTGAPGVPREGARGPGNQADDVAVRRVVLASREAQGVYNAARALLLESRPGGPAGRGLLEYSLPGVTHTESGPPVWITVLGRDGFWPVAVETPESAAEGKVLRWPAPSHVDFHMERLPRVWLAALLVFSLALWFVNAMALGTRFTGWREKAFTVPYSALMYPDEPRDRAVYLLLTLVILLGAYITLAAPAWRIWLEDRAAPGRLAAFCAIGSWILILCTAFSLGTIIVKCVRGRGRSLPEPGGGTSARKSSSLESGYLVLAVAGVLLSAVFAWLLWRSFVPGKDDSFRSFFFAYRSLDLGGGVSPIVPLLLLEMALACWGWIQSRRLQFHIEREVPLPFIERETEAEPTAGQLASRVEDAMEPTAQTLASRVERVVTEPFLGWQWRVFCAAGLTLLVTLLVHEYVRSIDSESYDALFVFLLALTFFLLFLTWSRFLATWYALRTLLEKLDQHPIRDAFSAMPPEAAWSPILQRGIMRRTYTMEARSMDTAMQIARLVDDRGKWDAEPLRKAVEAMLNQARTGLRIIPADQCATREALRPLFAAARKSLYADAWNRGCSRSAKKSEDESSKRTLLELPPAPKEQLQQLYAEFLATPYLVFIRGALLQMRNLLMFVAAGFVMAALAPSVYPFQSRHLIGWMMTALLAVFGAGIAVVWAQIDRDGLLSRITNKPPGSIEAGSFVLRLLAFGGLPLLTVVATQFPSVSRFLFSWVQPTLEALR